MICNGPEASQLAHVKAPASNRRLQALSLPKAASAPLESFINGKIQFAENAIQAKASIFSR